MQYKKYRKSLRNFTSFDALKKKNEIISRFVKRWKLNCPIFPSGIKGRAKHFNRCDLSGFYRVKGKDGDLLIKLKYKNITKKVGESGGKWGKNCTFATRNSCI